MFKTKNPNALQLKDGSWEIKINKKSFFLDIATGLAQLKMGSYSSAAKQGIWYFTLYKWYSDYRWVFNFNLLADYLVIVLSSENGYILL